MGGDEKFGRPPPWGWGGTAKNSPPMVGGIGRPPPMERRVGGGMQNLVPPQHGGGMSTLAFWEAKHRGAAVLGIPRIHPSIKLL